MQKNHPFCNFCYKKDEFILFEYHLEIYDYFTRITRYLLVDQNFEGFSIRRTYCLFASCSSQDILLVCILFQFIARCRMIRQQLGRA